MIQYIEKPLASLLNARASLRCKAGTKTVTTNSAAASFYWLQISLEIHMYVGASEMDVWITSPCKPGSSTVGYMKL